MLTSIIDRFIDKDSIKEKKYSESFNKYAVEILCTKLLKPDFEEIAHALQEIPIYDKVSLDISLDGMYPISFNRRKDINEFNEEFVGMLDTVQDDSEISFKINISKSISEENATNIYSISDFYDFVKNLSLNGLLYSFNELLNGRDYVVFNILDVDGISFSTSTFYFKSVGESLNVISYNRQELINKRNEICNYLNSSENILIPNDFYLTRRSPNEEFNSIFDYLSSILSVVFLADITKVTGENNFYFRLNGYKLVDMDLNMKSTKLVDNGEFYKIYTWVYNEGNLSDKVGLARNIVSLHYKIDETSFILRESTINSIISGYEIYLKQNVEQYIEVKNKVSEFLMEMSLRTSEIVNNFANSLKNNHFIFLSFFVSVFVFNALSSGKLKNIFTKDITYISYGLLVISFVYLIGTILQTYMELNRFKKQYSKLNTMYDDILDQEDLKNIFKDEYHEDDIKFIENKGAIYSFVWLVEIIALYCVVYILKL